MVGNEWDDILYWEDYEPFKRFCLELDRKYDISDPAQHIKWCKDRDEYYWRTIPTQEEFVRRFHCYDLHGKPHWVAGRHKLINELTKGELIRAYRFASDQNGFERVSAAEKARLGWASQHLPCYAAKACTPKSIGTHTILEMTVGAGVGTNAIVRSMADGMIYAGVDIDFICAKNADAIGRYYGKNALGICASLWHLPFEDDIFDVVCSHFGLDECREIDTILREAARVIKQGGRLVLVSRHNAWFRRHAIFEAYGIGERKALDLMREVRLYADFEQLDMLAAQIGFHKVDYVPFEKWYVAEYEKL